ncbi:MAG: secretin N-terminal domain-containing protein, partial [Verrucomicrobiales bacterium]|nr:secretin N-terminal domain-containing protein [Verrucomicrobiales bacterium]
MVLNLAKFLRLLGVILLSSIQCSVDAQMQAPRSTASSGDDSLLVNFPNAPISAILPYYEKLTGKKIIRDTNLESGTVSVVSESTLTKDEAIRFIDSALLLNGYAILPVDDSTLKIINYSGGKSLRAHELPVIADVALLPKSEQVVNFVMKLEHVSPTDAIKTFSQIVSLNPYGAMTPLDNNNSVIITESTSVIRMLLNFKDHVDTPPSRIIHEFVKLERADAERVSEILNGMFNQQNENAGAKPAPVAPPGENGKAVPEAVVNGNTSMGITVVPYKRTNSILVAAPVRDFDVVKDLIRTFDQPSDNVTFLKKKLQYVSVIDYMPSFYNALARGTDIAQREDLLDSTNSQSTGGLQDTTDTSGGSAIEGSAAARNLLNSPDDVGTPVTHMVGDTLLIGDPQANSLIVSGSPENICVIQKLIEEIDVQPKQVYLSTVIGQLTIGDDVNYSLNALQSLAAHQTSSGNRVGGAASMFNGGIVQPSVGGLTNSTGFPSAFQGLSLYGRFLFGTDNASLDSMLRLFAQDTKFKILSRPSVYAQNNVKAVISSGQRIAIPTSTLTTAGNIVNGVPGSIASNIEFRDVVLKLEVIPLINSDDQVTLKIAQVNDNIVGSQTISGNEIPTLSTQELITTVTLINGETMVLGGLITERDEETVTGIPGIRNIRFLGKALGSTDTSTIREEMLIFIQPHIVNGDCLRPNPNDLEKCRNSVMDDALQFADPFPPCPPCPIVASPVNDSNPHEPAPAVSVKQIKSGKPRTTRSPA